MALGRMKGWKRKGQGDYGAGELGTQRVRDYGKGDFASTGPPAAVGAAALVLLLVRRLISRCRSS